MKTALHPQFIYRVPSFHVNAKLEDCWPELKEAIRLSSPDFYLLVKDVPANGLDSLAPQLKTTIWKYFNRAKFRATPYGTFASFGCARFAGSQSTSNLELLEKTKNHCFSTWESKEKLAIDFDELVEQDFKLFANSSYYKLGTSFRYIYFEQGEFQLSEIEYSKGYAELLQQCAKPVKVSTLLKASSNPEQLLAEIEFLLSIQLLIHSGHPNIIGEDFFSRIEYKTQADDPKYVIAEHPSSSTISQHCFRHVPALIECLQQLLPSIDNAGLNNFIDRFTKKFELKEVPIMQALDPEAGIAYDDLAIISGDSDLIADLSAGKATDSILPLKDKMIHALLKGMTATKATINLESLVTTAPIPSHPVPNTFSLLCQTDGETVRIESLGGATATALNGRFSLASEEAHSLCRHLAALEQEANPEVLFFDIGYIAEGRVDNVNRRKSIYPLELNLLCYDTSQEPITLTDILLSVRGGELILRSQKGGKRLMPRLSSAYNYRRSDLPVFRLLCDLQSQKLSTSLNFTLSTLVPGLDFYPEVRFRNIIVSPRTWQLKAVNGLDNPLKLKQQLQTKIATRYVRTGRGDQTLYFDLKAMEDLTILSQLVLKEKELLIAEMQAPQQSIFLDHKANPYSGQLLLSLVHNENIFSPVYIPARETSNGCVDLFPPGGHWLYYEIYCHPYRSDELLLEKISMLLAAFERQIKTWFFIRYNEGGEHIRFRLRLHDPVHSQLVTAKLSSLLAEEIENGIVSDLRINLYRREVARYGPELMEATEAHFSKDSIFVLLLLAEQPTDFVKYRLCLELLSLVQKSRLFTQDEFASIIHSQSDTFNQEHRLKPEGFKRLNNEYKKYTDYECITLAPWLTKARSKFERSLLDLLNQCPPPKRKSRFADLVHMHINRLFAHQQRTHEMVVYYFALKELKRSGALKKQADLH